MTSMTAYTQQEPKRQAPLTLRVANGEPTILVVEDDRSIRNFVCLVLRGATRASVVDAGDPGTALSIAWEIGRPIDLLIADINLSATMNGIDLARKLSSINPHMKVLFISGADCPQCEIPAVWRFLAKPFPIERFLDCVRALCLSVSAPAAYFG